MLQALRHFDYWRRYSRMHFVQLFFEFLVCWAGNRKMNELCAGSKYNLLARHKFIILGGEILCGWLWKCTFPREKWSWQVYKLISDQECFDPFQERGWKGKGQNVWKMTGDSADKADDHQILPRLLELEKSSPAFRSCNLQLSKSNMRIPNWLNLSSKSKR